MAEPEAGLVKAYFTAVLFRRQVELRLDSP